MWKPKAKYGKRGIPSCAANSLEHCIKPFASHASRASATSKPAFTMSTEGDVFYDYVKRQFMSTVISADECL